MKPASAIVFASNISMKGDRSLIVGNGKLIVPQRCSDRSITGHRIAHHQHLPKQFSECAAMSIRTPHLDAITLPCTFTVSDKS